MKTLLSFFLALLVLGGAYLLAVNPVKGKATDMAEPETTGQYVKPTDEELKRKLTPLQYHVTQEAGTERPYTNEYWQLDQPGIYVDIVTGEPLFSSKDKYHSSCGWPSFSESLVDERIVEIEDRTFGMVRTEVRSRLGDTHLGHVFENDPESPNGIRYCINSASLRFIPLEQMEAEGYGDLLAEFE
ncbi:MAG TPA: peptide-methionine (R)-S-oxide reductase MsrB [Clostridia bacterium]|nr:peptide-methionine (R)-S-oxide reductase MsrB [Clostridia bacterium]